MRSILLGCAYLVSDLRVLCDFPPEKARGGGDFWGFRMKCAGGFWVFWQVFGVRDGSNTLFFWLRHY